MINDELRTQLITDGNTKSSVGEGYQLSSGVIVVDGHASLWITQRARLAVTLMLLDSAVKVLVFYIHERAWTRISGRGRSVELMTVQPVQPELELTA